MNTIEPYDKLMLLKKHQSRRKEDKLYIGAEVEIERVLDKVAEQVWQVDHKYCQQTLGHLIRTTDEKSGETINRFEAENGLECRIVDNPFNSKEIWLPEKTKTIRMRDLSDQSERFSEAEFDLPVKILPWEHGGRLETSVVIVGNEIIGRLIENLNGRYGICIERAFFPVEGVSVEKLNS